MQNTAQESDRAEMRAMVLDRQREPLAERVTQVVQELPVVRVGPARQVPLVLRVVQEPPVVPAIPVGPDLLAAPVRPGR